MCKFCNQEKRLILSHIIPKSFYQLKQHGNQSMLSFATKKIDKTRYQNGLKEYLMCAECDGMLGKLDEYAGKILFQQVTKHPFKNVDGIKTYLFRENEFDYKKLRLFFISLVWRASVSTLFNGFSLNKYEDIALKILKQEIPDNPDWFVPVVIRKQTSTPVDNISMCAKDKVCGKYACLIKFPDYEIKVITNTRDSKNQHIMELYKSSLTEKEFLVMETSDITDNDLRLLEAIRACL